MAETSSSSSQATPETGSYAIVEASGQQFWVQPNRYYDLDRSACRRRRQDHPRQGASGQKR